MAAAAQMPPIRWENQPRMTGRTANPARASCNSNSTLNVKTIILCAGLAVLSCALLADVPVGRGGFSATGTATGTYDSNVFGTAHDATGDFSGT